jgi:hypothetical protein
MLKHRAGGSLTLSEYFEQGKAFSSFHHYSDSDGKLLVDRVLRFEDLDRELAEVFAYLGVPFDGNLGVRAKSEYRTDRRHYREILNDAQRDRIADIFKREIAMFGYRY